MKKRKNIKNGRRVVQRKKGKGEEMNKDYGKWNKESHHLEGWKLPR